MKEELYPKLDQEILREFAEAEEPISDSDFTACITQKIENKTASRKGVLIFSVLIIFFGLLLFSFSIQELGALIATGLMTPIFSLENQWLAVFLYPFNNFAAITSFFFFSLYQSTKLLGIR